MIITNCNCGEKVTCNCGTLSFDSYVVSPVSVLDVGSLIASGGCTIDEYVIDWYRDGVHYLVSGEGLDPEIEAFHPFTGDGAILVEAGEFVPVLRYIVIAGVQIFVTPKPCQKWCEVVIDLPTITVNPLYCGLISAATPLSGFDYKISYNSSQDWALASRTARFELDASNTFFAFTFKAYQVEDRITIWHSNDLVNPIADYIVGSDLTYSDFNANPVEIDISGDMYIVLELPVYTEGAYLKIQVLPSVNSLNYNTNWDLNFKCLPPAGSGVGSYDFCAEWSRFTQAAREWDIDTLAFTWNATDCMFELTFEWPSERICVIATTEGLYKYAGMRSTGGGVVITTANPYVYGRGFVSRVDAPSYSQTGLAGWNTKINSYGRIFHSKSGNVFTFVCENQLDYDDLKAGWQHMETSTFKTDFVDDNTDINFYRRYLMNWYTAGALGCGDSETLKQYSFHIKSNFNWDDVNKTLTVTALAITNGMTSVSGCNIVYEGANSIVNTLDSTINLTDFTDIETSCRYTYPLSWGLYLKVRLPASAATLQEGIYWYGGLNAIPCTMEGYRISGSMQWMHYGFHVVITATMDANGNWLQDPLENFKVSAMFDKNGQVYAYPYYLVYEKQNGVVTTKVYWDDLPSAI